MCGSELGQTQPIRWPTFTLVTDDKPLWQHVVVEPP